MGTGGRWRLVVMVVGSVDIITDSKIEFQLQTMILKYLKYKMINTKYICSTKTWCNGSDHL